MKNKNVGTLIIGISIVIVSIVLIFNWGMKDILGLTCDMGPSCKMYKTLALQTYITLAIAGIIFVIGLFLVFSKEHEKIIIRTVKDKKKKISLEGLDDEEKMIVEILQKENGAIFQSSLMEMLGTGKVKITRLLDKLEAKELIERKRRGMNNIVVLMD